MNTLLSNHSPRGVHGKTKRLSEHTNYQYCNRYSTDLKRAKIETVEKVPGNSEIGSNVVVQTATTSGVMGLNDSIRKHGKAKDLQQQLIKKNGKMIGNEPKSSKLAAGSDFLCSSKSGTSSPLMPHNSSHSISENGRGVSVSRKILHGLERHDLPAAKSDVLINRVSQPAGLLDATTKISERHDFSSSGRKMGKNESTGVAARDRNKLKPVNRDQTCEAAQRKTSPEYQLKSAVGEELQSSSPKRQNGHRAGNFSEKKSRSERVSSSSVSSIEARVMAKNQGKTVPEPTEGEQKINLFAPMTESGVSNPNLALDIARSPQSTTNSSAILGNEHQQVSSRDKVQKALKEFKELFTQLLKERKIKPRGERQGTYRADLKAAKILKKRGKWINCYPCFGHVPGVNVGDRFQYRTELAIIGLHREYVCGIHCEKIDGKIYATSIVDSGRYYNNHTINADEFIYMGEGGNPEVSSGLKDQKLNGGNLALKNSMDSEIPVRVIRGSPDVWGSNTTGRSGITFVYYGLYQVTNCVYCRDPESGNKVFQFTMKRKTDNSNLTQQTSSSSSSYVPRISTIQRKQGVMDYSDTSNQQQEKMLSSAVKNVNKNKTSMFLYNSTPQCYGGNRPSTCSGIWNEDEGFDYEAGAVIAKLITSNRRAYASHANSKLKLS